MAVTSLSEYLTYLIQKNLPLKVYGSQVKAVASAAFGRDSGVMQERAGAPIIQGIMAAEGGHMIPSQGAVPIIRNGDVIGAVGAGGGTGQEDEDCSRAGAEAV